MPNEISSSPQSTADWDGLASAADAGPQFQYRSQARLKAAGVQQLSFGDRIAQRVFSGTLPLFLLIYTALIFSTWHDGIAAAAFNVPTALVLTWLLRPFLQSANGTCLKRYVLMVLPVMALSWPAPLLPEAGLNYLRRKDWHLEFIPGALQKNMESSLQVSHFLAYLLLALAVALVSRAVQNRFYWIEVAPTPRSALYWRSLFWILSLVLLSFVFWRDLTPTEAELKWSREQKKALESQPFASLPLEGESKYWRSLLKKAAPTFHGDLLDEELEGLPFTRPKDSSMESFVLHPPSSGFELNACKKYYLLLGFRSAAPEIHFQAIELEFLGLTRSNVYRYWPLLLQNLGRNPLDSEKLESWRTELEQLGQLRPSREEELDLAAYRSLLDREVGAA